MSEPLTGWRLQLAEKLEAEAIRRLEANMERRDISINTYIGIHNEAVREARSTAQREAK